MITIFNRRELISTFDIDEQARIRSILAHNDIDYTVKTVDINRDNHFDHRNQYEYIIYVKKDDLDEAICLINKRSG